MILEEFTLQGRKRMIGHAHRGMHLCFVTDGGFEEQIDGDRMQCTPGVLRISPGHTCHDLHVDSNGAQGKLVELHFRAESGLQRPLNSSVFLATDQHPAATITLNTAWQQSDLFAVECVVLELAAAAVAGCPQNFPAWLDELREEVDSHPEQIHRLSSLGKRLDRHRAHIARAFRNRFGRSIGEHVRAARIYRALSRLRDSDEPVAAIALDLGFYDQAHFTRLFRRHLGTTPVRYRREQAAS